MAKFKSDELTVGIPFAEDFDYLIAVKITLPLGLDSRSGEVALTPQGRLAAFRFLGQDIPSPLYNKDGWSTWLTSANQGNNPLNIKIYGEDSYPFQIQLNGTVEYGFNFEHEEVYPSFGEAVKEHIYHVDSDRYRIIEGESYQ